MQNLEAAALATVLATVLATAEEEEEHRSGMERESRREMAAACRACLEDRCR